MPVDPQKCRALKESLRSQAEPQIVPIATFFDGNNDMGSIGCNVFDHPGFEAFRRVLVGLLQRPDVDGVYAEIVEVDPGEDRWPYADTVYVVGSIYEAICADLVAELSPDELGQFSLAALREIGNRHPGKRMIRLWWD